MNTPTICHCFCPLLLNFPVNWFSLLYNFFRESVPVFHQKVNILILVAKIVWKHYRNLIDNGVESVTTCADKSSVHDYIPFRSDFEEFKWIVLVYRTCKNVKQFSLHGSEQLATYLLQCFENFWVERTTIETLYLRSVILQRFGNKSPIPMLTPPSGWAMRPEQFSEFGRQS